MVDSALTKKLQLKPGFRAALINAPPDYSEKLGVAVATKLGSDEASLDFVQIFVKSIQELDELVPQVKKVLKYDGLFWVCYPRGCSKVKTDLNRDIIWKDVARFGLSAIANVSR